MKVGLVAKDSWLHGVVQVLSWRLGSNGIRTSTMYSIWFTKIEPSGSSISALLAALTLSRFIPQNRRTGTQSGFRTWMFWLTRFPDFLHCFDHFVIESAVPSNEQVVNIHSHIQGFDGGSTFLSTHHFEKNDQRVEYRNVLQVHLLFLAFYNEPKAGVDMSLH